MSARACVYHQELARRDDTIIAYMYRSKIKTPKASKHPTYEVLQLYFAHYFAVYPSKRAVKVRAAHDRTEFSEHT